MILFAIIAPIAAYLLGSISFAVIFTNLFSKTDVRSHGSGNAGTTNVLRVSGIKAGVLTFLCDALKGVAACLLGIFLFRLAFGSENNTVIMFGKYLCAVACMLGHAYPVFFGFMGGKCAATSVGIFAVCCPLAIILGLCGFAVSMLFTRIVSLSTLVATTIVATVSIIQNGILDHGFDISVIILTVMAGIIVFWRHKENIKRLIKGQEKKLSVKK